VSHGEPAQPQVLLDYIRQPQKAQGIRDGGAILANPASQVLLSPPELRQEALVGMSLLKRIQVFPEEILHEGKL